ncbi:hypothetical protein FGB62_95g048 [Gracilaria domingensis]|nr:hypothetical protein FGB62_95g048 [Gracilaria domingensis]
MWIRSLHYERLDVSDVTKALADMDVPARFTADVSHANAYLRGTPILKLISDAVANEMSLKRQTIDVSGTWKVVDEHHWKQALQFAKGFEWQPIEVCVDRILKTADEVIAGEESMIESLGDPFIFKSTFRQDHEYGLQVSFVLQAMFIVSLVESHGGTFIWNRSAWEPERIGYKKFPVSWKDGKYVLKHTHVSRFFARFHTRSKRGAARLLDFPHATREVETLTSSGHSKQEVRGFAESRDPARAAIWANITVRELRLHALSSLLETNQNHLVKYAAEEGVDLADLLALGLRTAVHSRIGLVLWHNSRVLSWPSLSEATIEGYSFMLDWGLTREMQLLVGAKRRYHYLRAYCDANQRKWAAGGRKWVFANNETYESFPSVLNKPRSALDILWWYARGMISNEEAFRRNKLDAQARLRRPRHVKYIESAEESSLKPPIGDLMLASLSERIDLENQRGCEVGYQRCFGEKPGKGNEILDDEMVTVLSYRHESPSVRMSVENWKYCYEDICTLILIHGKKAARVWTDKLASIARKGATWIESGVEPYRNGIVLAFNGIGDSVLVDRFWISMERNTAIRAWGYWFRDDLGQMTRFANEEYPARKSDREFLRQILCTPGRSDGPLWEEDRLEVIREAADLLGVSDINSFWECLCEQQLEEMFVPFETVHQKRNCGERNAKGWEPLVDCLVDRDLIEKSLKFELKDRSKRKVIKWRTGESERVAAAESWTSDQWFVCLVELQETDGRLKLADIIERKLMTMTELEFLLAACDRCDEEVWE